MSYLLCSPALCRTPSRTPTNDCVPHAQHGEEPSLIVYRTRNMARSGGEEGVKHVHVVCQDPFYVLNHFRLDLVVSIAPVRAPAPPPPPHPAQYQTNHRRYPTCLSMSECVRWTPACHHGGMGGRVG